MGFTSVVGLHVLISVWLLDIVPLWIEPLSAMLVCCSTVLTQGQMGLCDKKVGANCGSEDIKRPSILSKPHHLKLLVSDKNCTILLLGLAGIIIELEV